MSAEHDPVVQRAVDELRKLPPLDREAIARVTRAAASARVSPAELDPADMPRGRSIRVWSAVGLATAAAIAGFIIGGAHLAKTPTPTVAEAPVAKAADSGAQLQLATRGAADVAPVPQQFVFENTHARRVSVVGDFNNWDAKKNVMARDGDGLWSAIIPIVPGRHSYLYVVDDSIFTLDPRRPKMRDPDLGGESSVLMVGRP